MNKAADILINASTEKDFEKCLDSAVSQTGWSGIIVADRLNSTSVRNIIESKNNQSIKYLNCSGQSPMQTCVTLANSSEATWLKYICNNEILMPGCLENLITSAESFENIAMSFGGFKTVTDGGTGKTTTYDFPEYISGQDYLFNIYSEIPFRTLSNTLVRRSVVTEINPRLLPDRLYSVHGVISMYAMINGSLTYINEVTAVLTKNSDPLPDVDTLADNLEHIINPCNYAMQKLPALKKRLNNLKSQLLSEEIKEIACELAEAQRYSDVFKLIGTASRIKIKTSAVILSPSIYKPAVRRIYQKLSKKPTDG